MNSERTGNTCFDDAAATPLGVSAPHDLLELPFPKHRRFILRFQSGLVLDPHLRKLSRVSGAVDRWLAHALGRIRDAGRLVRLGHATFDGYVTERLGLKPRTAREMARVGKSLQRLPQLDRALRGDRVTWSAAAQVARLTPVIASELDERCWVDTAAKMPFARLKEAVDAALAERRSRPAEAGGGSRAGGEGGAAPDAELRAEAGSADGPDEDPAGDTDETSDEDPLVPMAVLAGAGTARLWGAGLELCEIVVGKALTPGEGEEHLLQEFLSGTTPAQGPFADAKFLLPEVRRRRRRGRVKAPGREPTPELGERPLSVEVSAEIANALMLVDRPVPEDLFELDACARQLLRARAGMDLHLGRMLRIFQSLDLARHLGFSNFGAYVEQRLAISASRAKSLATLDRLLTDLPEVERAVRKGQVRTLAALAIARIARRGPSERAWVRRARTRTLIRLREEVAWAETQAERDPRFDFMPPPTAPLPSDLAEVTAKVSPEAARRTSACRSHAPWVRLTGDPSIDDDPFADDPPRAAPGYARDRACDEDSLAEGKNGGSGSTVSDGVDAGGEDPASADAGSTSGKGRRPAGVAGVGCDAQGEAGPATSSGQGQKSAAQAAQRGHRRDAETGRAGSTSAGEAGSDRHAGRFPDAGTPFAEPDSEASPLVRVRFFLRQSATADWSEAQRRIASSLENWHVPDRRVLYEIAVAFLRTWLPEWIDALTTQDPTAVRDRFRCQMPGCKRRRGSGHHLHYRSRGGSDDLANLLFLCETCHLEAIHRLGSLRIRGRAPDLLVAEVGLRPDGRALEIYLRRPFGNGTGCSDSPAAPSAA